MVYMFMQGIESSSQLGVHNNLSGLSYIASYIVCMQKSYETTVNTGVPSSMMLSSIYCSHITILAMSFVTIIAMHHFQYRPILFSMQFLNKANI